MKPPLTFRSLPLALLAVGLALATAGCQGGNASNVAGANGPGEQTDVRSSGVGPGGHQPATSSSTHGPSGAGPAGSQ